LDYYVRFAVGIYVLKDGRVCMVGNKTDVSSYTYTTVSRHAAVSDSLSRLVTLGMGDWEREYLGVSSLPAEPVHVSQSQAVAPKSKTQRKNQRKRANRRAAKALLAAPESVVDDDSPDLDHFDSDGYIYDWASDPEDSLQAFIERRRREAAAAKRRLKRNPHLWRHSDNQEETQGRCEVPWHCPFPQVLTTSCNTAPLQKAKLLMPFATSRVPSDAQLLKSIDMPDATLQLRRWELGAGDIAFVWVATNLRGESWSHVLGTSDGRGDEGSGARELRVTFKLAPGTTSDVVYARTGCCSTEEEALGSVLSWTFDMAPREQLEHKAQAEHGAVEKAKKIRRRRKAKA